MNVLVSATEHFLSTFRETVQSELNLHRHKWSHPIIFMAHTFCFCLWQWCALIKAHNKVFWHAGPCSFSPLSAVVLSAAYSIAITRCVILCFHMWPYRTIWSTCTVTDVKPVKYALAAGIRHPLSTPSHPLLLFGNQSSPAGCWRGKR